jgi:hypothetical protein
MKGEAEKKRREEKRERGEEEITNDGVQGMGSCK